MKKPGEGLSEPDSLLKLLHFPYPDAQCMAYLPTKLGSFLL